MADTPPSDDQPTPAPTEPTAAPPPAPGGSRGGFDPNAGTPPTAPPAAATPPPPAPGGFTPPPPAPGGFTPPPPAPGGFTPPPPPTAPPAAATPPPPAPGGFTPPPPAPQPPAGGYQQPAPGMGATPPPPTFVPTQTGGYVAPPPGESKSSNGCLKAFLIVGGIVAVLAVIGVVLLVAGVLSFSKAINDTFGEAPSSAYKLTVDNCESSSSGASADGTIKNTSDNRHTFQLDVSFTSASGVKLGSDSFVSTPSLSPGETGTWDASSYSITTDEAVKCKVDKVSFFGS